MVLAPQGSTLDINVDVKLDENKEKWRSAVQTIEATLSLMGSAWLYIKGGPKKKGNIKKLRHLLKEWKKKNRIMTMKVDQTKL